MVHHPSYFREAKEVVSVAEIKKANTLYDAYKNWCTEEGVSALSQKKLGSALAKRGCQRRRASTGRYLWQGLELASTPENLEFLE